MSSPTLKSEIAVFKSRIPKVHTFMNCCKIHLETTIPLLEKKSLPSDQEKALSKYKTMLQQMVDSWMNTFQKFISTWEWIEPELKTKQLKEIISPFSDKVEFGPLMQELISLHDLERALYCIDEVMVE